MAHPQSLPRPSAKSPPSGDFSGVTLDLGGRHVHFVLPMFNELPNADTVVRDLALLSDWVRTMGGKPHTTIVDDGSTDGTADALRTGGSELTLLQHERNQGPGRAFQTAFESLLDRGLAPTDFVVTLEGDATSDPWVFRRMLVQAMMGDDVVLASPYSYGGGFSKVSPFRLVLSHIANGTIKLALGIRGINTFSCFYRVYTGNALLKLESKWGRGRIVEAKGFECAVEVLSKLSKESLPISEVAFRVDWSRRKGKSKMKLWRTAFRYLLLIFK